MMTSHILPLLLLITISVCEVSAAGPPAYVYPEHVHLSYGETEQQMVVTWTTFNITDSVVEFGTNRLSNVVKGKMKTFYDKGDSNRTWFIHRVTLDNLKPGVKYYYHCGSDQAWSDLYHFTNRRTDKGWVPKIAAFGDMGSVNAQSIPRLEEEIAQNTIDVVLHVGDFAYDLNTDQGYVGDAFMQQIQPISAYVPYMTTVGNHESAMNFSHYKQRFSMPGDTEGMFYSYNLGQAHIISISTEAFYYPQYGNDSIKTQYNWLKADLQKANTAENRARYPWIIVLGHRPMYCSIIPNTDDCDLIRDQVRLGLEQLFYEQGVDLEIWAHEHEYQRIFPLYNYTLCKGSESEPYKNPRAPVHVISGSAGCDERHDKFPKKPEWVDKNILDYGYTKIQALNYTHLYMEQISDDQHGAVVDRLYIEQHYHGAGQFKCHLDPNPHRVPK